MTEMLHIVRKDVRHLRLPLVVWFGLLLGRAALGVVAGMPVDPDLVQRELFGPANGMMGFLEVLLQAFIVARLFHDEPAVGLNAFWLTRPYRRGTLVAAKLAFAVGVLVILPAVRDAVVLELFGATAGQVGRAMAATAVSGTLTTFAVAVLAALTPSLTVFIMTILGIVVTVVTSGVILATFGAFIVQEPVSRPPSFVFDNTSPLVASALLVVAAIAVIRYQYARRSWWRGAALAVGCLVALLVVSEWWPWRFARVPEPDPGAWAATARAVLVPGEKIDTHTVTFGRTVLRNVNAPVDLEGMPGEFHVRSIYTRGRLTLEDGTTIRSEQAGRFAGAVRVGAPSPIRTALGVAAMEPSTEQSYVYPDWPALIAMPEPEYARHRGKRGTIDARLDFHVQRYRVVATLPLALHAAWNGAGLHAEIVALQPLDDGVNLQVRWWKIDSLVERRMTTHEFVVRNRRRSEAVGAQRQLAAYAIGGGILPGGFGLSMASPSTVQIRLLDFPARWEQPVTAIRVDRAWLADAELAIVEGVYAGRVTKRLTAEGFQLP